MKKNKSIKALPDSVRESLRVVGRNIQLARKRRRYNQKRVAELAKTSRDTIRRIEAGDPSVSWGIVAHVLWALQLDHVLEDLAAPERDEHGLALANRALPERVRSSEDGEYDF